MSNIDHEDIDRGNNIVENVNASQRRNKSTSHLLISQHRNSVPMFQDSGGYQHSTGTRGNPRRFLGDGLPRVLAVIFWQNSETSEKEWTKSHPYFWMKSY